MKRSKHSLSYTKLFSCDMGELIPIGLVEVLPGDSFQHATQALVRLSPLLAPVMHPVKVHIRHFFVPHRLVWDNFEDFITGGPDGLDDSVFPTVTLGPSRPATSAEGSLGDYLGLPPTTVGNFSVSALPFRGYSLIWNEFYRDQDLQTELVVSKDDGTDTTTNITLQRVNWAKDYFTTSRPWEQKGASTSVPITNIGGSDAVFRGQTDNVVRTLQVQTGGVNAAFTGANAAGTTDMRFESGTGAGFVLELQTLREAMALMRYEEARARFGSRYVEYLRYLGVRSSDARLQRPEYLGGGIQTLQFSEVLQTAEGTDPVGDLKGHGIAAMRSNRYRRFFEEHGYVFTFMSIRPDAIYIQGLHKHWQSETKEDFWQMELQHIGQQEVFNWELNTNHADPGGTWGWQDRYDQYRRMPSQVSGEFRSSTLNYWHFARDVPTDTALNSGFVTCTPTERTFAVPSQDVVYVQARHSIQARRLVSQSGRSSYIY